MNREEASNRLRAIKHKRKYFPKKVHCPSSLLFSKGCQIIDIRGGGWTGNGCTMCSTIEYDDLILYVWDLGKVHITFYMVIWNIQPIMP